MADHAQVTVTATCPYAACGEGTNEVTVEGDHADVKYKVVQCPECDEYYTAKVTITASGAVTEYKHD